MFILYPNQKVSNIIDSLELEVILSNTSDQPCFIASDVNIDITKCNISNDTEEYVENL